jgi:AraC-like DNA-binding protein
MQATTLYAGESLTVYRYRCSAGPQDRPYAEVHRCHSVSYVRSGSFGCATLGTKHELVAGSVLIGRPGQEYTATHEHHGCGDECVSVKLSPAAAERLKLGQNGVAALPPLPEIMLLGEVSVDEAAILFVQKVAEVVSRGKANSFRSTESERRRAVEAALWLEANLAGQVRLEDVARQAGSSPFHFLRVFRKAIGVTPHQYLLRLRLREAARLLAEGSMPVTQVALEVGFQDLSNFVRTFKRAAGVPPARFSKRLPRTRSSLKLLGELHV